jgi:hypothetical protein
MLVDPTGRLFADSELFDAEGLGVEAVYRGFSVPPGTLITQRSYEKNVFVNQSSRVEIGRWKNRIGIAKNVDCPVWFRYKDVVVNSKIGVVGVLVLACDLYNAVIR